MFFVFQVLCKSATVRRQTRENTNAWPRTLWAHNMLRPCNCGSEVSGIIFFVVIIITFFFLCMFCYYIFVRTTEQTTCCICTVLYLYAFFNENPIVCKNKEQTRKLKSHYFPFICCFFFFFHSAGSVHIFFFNFYIKCNLRFRPTGTYR